MKRKTILAIAAAGLCAALLCGCGGSASSAASSAAASSEAASSEAASSAAESTAESTSEITATDLQAIADALLEVDPISNAFALDENLVTLDMGLSMDDVVAYAGAKSNDSGDSATVFLIEAADGKIDAALSALDDYRAAQAAQMANYSEFADAQANYESNYVLTSVGNVAILAVQGLECSDFAALESAVEEVGNLF